MSIYGMDKQNVFINTMYVQNVYIHTMEYYLALKRKEILTHATTYTNLEDMMLSEKSQSQRDKYCMIPLI